VNRLLQTAVLAALAMSAMACDAKTLEDQGKALSITCAACHGEKGKASVPIYPNLAGQNKAYLEMTMKAYRSKDRTGLQAEAMYGIAEQLSDENIKALAAYYSSLKR
jgi:cytochrome c553